MTSRVLADKNGIYIEDENDNNVYFHTHADFKRYTGQDLSAYARKMITYEPVKNIMVASRESGELEPLTDLVLFETLVSNVTTYQSRIANPVYGLTGQELLDKQAELMAIDEYRQKVEDIRAEQTANNTRNYTPEQIKAYIDNQIAGAVTADEKFQVVVRLIKRLAIEVLRPDPPVTGG